MSGWLRGALELAVLAVLAEEDRHGYALAHRLAEQGLGTVRGGALYPVLGKLEASGAVRATWQPGDGGPGRKVYAITADGRDRLLAERARWQEFATAFARLLDVVHAPDARFGEVQP
ncbi:PadR family transcriptional regulator [Couchioplanes caeruleus subsp. caeruleus]|uniref:PadR family transcriptional regulator n=2 Tax=Couchioplanes caeruleus TaxID=56438 RepID=A0A1K0FNU8_9ACTN|nr:PadR family transcriptional regulator [Couchioplanes caeruleus subsp. caeruleus]